MPVKSYDTNDGTKPTRSLGNAGGKPALPVFLGAGAVAALIIALIAMSLRANRDAAQETTGRIGVGNSTPVTQPVAKYPSASTGRTATGNVSDATGQVTARGGQVVPPGPAVAPIVPSQNGVANPSGVSQSGSASLPMQESKTGNATMGRNIIAPPGPAANGNAQGTPR